MPQAIPDHAPLLTFCRCCPFGRTGYRTDTGTLLHRSIVAQYCTNQATDEGATGCVLPAFCRTWLASR